MNPFELEKDFKYFYLSFFVLRGLHPDNLNTHAYSQGLFAGDNAGGVIVTFFPP
jgi:hypothetical protein